MGQVAPPSTSPSPFRFLQHSLTRGYLFLSPDKSLVFRPDLLRSHSEIQRMIIKPIQNPLHVLDRLETQHAN